MKDKFKNITMPVMEKQTLFQLSQLKTFVDTSLKDVASKKFETEEAKIKYLLDTLYNIRDFVLSQTVENSLRLSLIQQFNKIEEEEILGNSQKMQEGNLLKNKEEKLEQDPKELEKEEKEVEIESTADS